jgi:hypothetical protein
MTHPVSTKHLDIDSEPVPALPAEALELAWFESRDRRPSSRPPSSAPPPPVETLGEFLGDPLADRWLR